MLENLIMVFIFLFGLIMGSFYNVVIYRLPLDISIAVGRSKCPSCENTLAPKDLVPVFSQLFLRNRCRYCQTKISMRYPAVEVLTGILFLSSYLLHGLTFEMILYWVLWSVLLITMMIDLDHKMIVDCVLVVGVLPAVVYMIMHGTYRYHLTGAIVGFGIFLVIHLLARVIYKKEAFGMGDVLLIGMIGMFLGFEKTILTCYLSFILGALVILIRKLAGQKILRHDEIPFGPYICVGAFIASVAGDQLINAYFELMY